MPRTKTEAALEEAERQHESDPERAELIARSRRFKSSWVDLAEGLTTVRKTAAWKAWGFATFEDYTRKELHLRPETVDKLTGSFSFLQQRAPQVLARDGVSAPIPSFQSVDFLRRAAEQASAPEEAVREIHRRVIEEAAPLPALTRKFRSIVFPEPPLADDEQRERDVRALRVTARRLHEQLAASGDAIPRGLRKHVSESLDELLAALGDDA